MKSISKVICTLFCLFSIQVLIAQPDTTTTLKSSFDLGFEGMIGASAGNNFYAFNVGGPSFKYRITKNLKIGLGALPSFYIKEGSAGAKLGVSPRIDYKKFVLIAPFFHFEHNNQWVWSIGMGVKF
jgi:hypothetical protein